MYMRTNENKLTERERKYLEYWMIKHPIKVRTFIFVFFVVIFTPLFLAEKYAGANIWICIVGSYGLPAFLGAVLVFRTWWDMKNLKDVFYGNPDILRTTIVMKDYFSQEVHLKTNATFDFYCFFCKGISERVNPLSKKLYKKAKVGDDVTVVMVEHKNIFLGITFDEKFDKKIMKGVSCAEEKRRDG